MRYQLWWSQAGVHLRARARSTSSAESYSWVCNSQGFCFHTWGKNKDSKLRSLKIFPQGDLTLIHPSNSFLVIAYCWHRSPCFPGCLLQVLPFLQLAASITTKDQSHHYSPVSLDNSHPNWMPCGSLSSQRSLERPTAKACSKGSLSFR